MLVHTHAVPQIVGILGKVNDQTLAGILEDASLSLRLHEDGTRHPHVVLEEHIRIATVLDKFSQHYTQPILARVLAQSPVHQIPDLFARKQ